MDSEVAGFVSVLIIVGALAVWMMARGFGPTGQKASEELRRGFQDTVADAVKDGIERHEDDKRLVHSAPSVVTRFLWFRDSVRRVDLT